MLFPEIPFSADDYNFNLDTGAGVQKEGQTRPHNIFGIPKGKMMKVVLFMFHMQMSLFPEISFSTDNYNVKEQNKSPDGSSKSDPISPVEYICKPLNLWLLRRKQRKIQKMYTP